MIAVFYHLFATGEWLDPTTEFMDAMVGSGLAKEVGMLHLGLIGSLDQREEAHAFCRNFMPTEVVAEADEGWEQETLEALRLTTADVVGYFHTKGAAVTDAWNAAWRRSMYLTLVSEWRECLSELQDHDAVGCHLLDLKDYPTIPGDHRFFAGNCWWARGDLVRELPVCARTSRYDAEVWVGANGLGRAVDRTPGWPSPESIRQEVRDGLNIPHFRVPPQADATCA
jgi:hypothetical protein